MSFKENLLKKIKINQLSDKIKLTLGPADSERRLDKSLMRQLLSLSPLKSEVVRDLEIYRIPQTAPGKEMMLVLDNDLAFYNTTVEDVAMRKSPTVKEMVSIRNAIKILNDKDVVISKKEGSLDKVREMCLETLDLSYERSDLSAIASEGRAALELDNTEGVMECLTLFSELTGYVTPPGPFKFAQHYIIGKVEKTKSGDIICGPLVLFDYTQNKLRLIDREINTRDKTELAWLAQVAQGGEPAAMEGTSVISFLENLAVERMPAL